MDELEHRRKLLADIDEIYIDLTTEDLEKFHDWIIKHIYNYEQMEQDIRDLEEIYDPSTCLKCNRYYPTGYKCPHCGFDNSVKEKK